MRILAIRGENLASLAAPFEIDLTQEPLAGAGLFAITGDTGAGKSTILDALCLALYNDYPRAQIGTKESTPDPSGGEIQASDPRNILRRGAGSGRAEVDFIGQDGIAYRATWAVRRARDRATGRLQNVERKLDRLDGSGNVAVGINDVGASVVDKTGLTYDQFCRTVLLAQGEFDTFLMATEKDRADLLEKITGTGIYSRISVRVHEEKDKREREIASRMARLAGIEILSDEARGALAQEQSDKTQALATADAARKTLAARKQRANDIKAARANLLSAQQAVAESDERWKAALPDREHLAALDAIAPLRPLVDARALCRERFDAAGSAHLAAKEAVRASADPLDACRTQTSALENVVRTALDTLARYQPEWDRAAALDRDIHTAAKELDGAVAHHTRAKESLDRENAALQVAKARIASLTRKRTEIDAQLEAQSALAPLHEMRERIKELMDDATRISSEFACAHDSHKSKEGALAEAVQRLQKFEGEIRTKQDCLVELRKRFDACRQEISALRLNDVERREREARKLDRLLADAARAVAQRDGARTAIDFALAAQTSAEEAQKEAIERLAEYERACEKAQLQRDALAPLAELAEATASQQAAVMRVGLIDNEPCPVCGSQDHPFAKDGSHLALVERLLADRAALDAEITRLQRAALDVRGKEADARARAASAEQRAQEHTGDLNEWLAKLTYLVPEIESVAKRADLRLVDVARSTTDTLSRDTVAAAVAVVTDAVHDIEIIRDKASELAKERDKIESEIGVLTDAIAETEAAAREWHARADKLRVDIAALAAQCELLEGQKQRSRAALDPFLTITGRTADALDSGADEVRLRITALADAYGSSVKALAEIDSHLDGAKRELLELEAGAAAAGREFVRLTEEVDKRRNAYEALTAERALLLDGEPTSEHRKRHERALAAAEANLHSTRNALKEAEIGYARATEVLTGADNVLEEARLALRNADDAYAVALERSGHDEARAAALLAIPTTIRDEIAVRIEQIQTECRNARTTLETRTSDLTKLAPRDDEASDEDIASLDAEYALIDAAANALRERLAVIGEELRRDTENAAKLDSQRSEIEVLQADLDVWRAVHEAIGSADGAKFKRYAQGITLRHLVALANRQLAALNPRYALQQSAASNLALDVVDREMGEDARSPRSLSGGERFLISLALALALSGLEGRRSFVDTLFIDEGFGSLDRDTLDIAIDALEALQGQGRKVGLITHVQAMMDRIAVQVRVEKRGGGRSVVQVGDSASGGLMGITAPLTMEPAE